MVAISAIASVFPAACLRLIAVEQALLAGLADGSPAVVDGLFEVGNPVAVGLPSVFVSLVAVSLP